MRDIRGRLKERIIRKTLPFPFHARHMEYSVLASPDDDPAKPSARLLDLASAVIAGARAIDLAAVSQRMHEPPYWPDFWPGEHYKPLAALVTILRPRCIIEIGTFTGLSSLSMRSALSQEGRLVTFDLVPWDQVPHTCLVPDDFADGRLTQILGDLSQPEVFAQHKNLLKQAELFFIDGPKDKVFEKEILAALSRIEFRTPPILVFDDIRIWNMLKIWREIDRPKLDITSFGHWTGTGLVDWVVS
jgi:predicted O-methyltransferase YrrM